MATCADDVINVLEDLVARWRSRAEIAVPRPKPKPPEAPPPAPPPAAAPRESASAPVASRAEESPALPPPAGTVEERIVALLAAPVHVDDLARSLDLSPSQLATPLLKLELARRIQRLPGGRYVVA